MEVWKNIKDAGWLQEPPALPLDMQTTQDNSKERTSRFQREMTQGHKDSSEGYTPATQWKSATD